jgi:excisionase family DNA binding protein
MPKQTELLTKHLAAERLGLSVRRMMEFSNDGTFTRHRAFDPDTKREAVMFDAAEVEAFKAKNAAMPAPLAERPRLLLDAPAGEPSDDEPAAGADDGRPWLTIAGAAEYSGLPASHLLAAIDSGELVARDVGVRPGGHWRIRRLDLDGLAGRRAGFQKFKV